jgi:hypothetical protein
MELGDLLKKLGEKEVKLNILVKERKVLEVRGREKEIDVEIIDLEGTKDLVRALR